MSVNSIDNRLYLKFAELKVAFDKGLDLQKIETIIKNHFDINYRVPSHLTGMPGVDGLTALHLAQHERCIDISNFFLRYGADFTMKSNLGSTALHSAIERAYEHETFRLLEATHYFVDLILSAHIQSQNFNNPCNNNGISHFHAACTVNNVEAVRFFLDNGVSVDQAIDVNSPFLPGYTALHIAVKLYNLETVAILLQCNADVHAKSFDGMTPLHVCVKQKLEMCNNMHNYSKTTNEWVKKKLEITDNILHLMLQKHSLTDNIRLSHLHVSCIMADSSVAKQLLDQDVNIDHSVNMNSPIFAGYTALHFAAQCNIDTVKLLVTKGANMELKDSKGLSPLDLCLQKYNVTKVHSVLSCHPVWKDILLVDNKTKLLDLILVLRNSEQFQLLKKNIGLNVKQPLIPCTSALWPGYTLLHLVVTLSNDRDGMFYNILIAECLNKGADLTSQDSFGSTPLHLAIEKEKFHGTKMYWFLWNSCEKIENPVNGNSLSHLHILCLKYSNVDVAEKYMLNDKKQNKQSHIPYQGRTIAGIISGSTPLHLAIPDIKKTKILLEHGADIYAVDVQGFTAIHRFIDVDGDHFKEIREILLAIPDLKDSVVRNIGLSHLHVASHLDDVESLEKLLDRGADINARISPELPAKFSFLAKYAGFTALHIAVSRHNKKTVDFLVHHGADIFVQNANGLPLLYEILSLTQGEHLKSFIDALKSNYTFQRRFSEETGLTMFHVACHKLDVNLMKHYWLKAGTSVDVQARADSPIWSGFTALHIARNRMRLLCCHLWKSNLSAEGKLRNDNFADGALEFLLSNGADITIADANGNTAIHLFFQNMVTECKKDFTRVSSVLKAQKDFSLNPTDSEGMSHFHIACGMNDLAAVQQFLKHGVVDVNKPNNRGDTSLHLSTGSSIVDFSGSAAQLKTIKLLLKHGAKINAKNNLGNTPLHEAASGRSPVVAKVFEILLKAGADPNAENVFSSTPLELLCKSKAISAKHLKVFTQFGCNLNAFNPVSNEGFIGLILHTIDQSSKRDSIWKAVLRLPEVKKVDTMGRSVIHNVVSLKGFSAQTFSHLNTNTDFLKVKSTYKNTFELFTNSTWDIDTQDKKGETALHKAVKFSNVAAVSALIEAGADVNVVDRSGKTALAYAFEPHLRSKYSILNSNDEEINNILLRQVIILQHCHFHVCKINKDIQVEATKMEYLWFVDDLSVIDELSRANDVKIGESLSLRRFLSEKIISGYPYMSISSRNSIQTFVNSLDNSEFPQLKSLIKLQFRQAEKRVNLVKDATNSLRSLLNSHVPDVCSRMIFESLRNADLENLIAAATEQIVQ